MIVLAAFNAFASGLTATCAVYEWSVGQYWQGFALLSAGNAIGVVVNIAWLA